MDSEKPKTGGRIKGALDALLGPKKPEAQKLECDTCGLMGEFKSIKSVKEIEDSDETIEFFGVRMKTCGHAFIGGCLDDRSRAHQAELVKLSQRISLLLQRGDKSGAIRTEKKYRAKQIALRDAMKNVWATWGHLMKNATPVGDLIYDHKTMGKKLRTT